MPQPFFYLFTLLPLKSFFPLHFSLPKAPAFFYLFTFKKFSSLFVFPFQRRQPFFTFLPFYLFTFKKFFFTLRFPFQGASLFLPFYLFTFLPLKVPPQSHLQTKVARMFFEHGLHVAAVVEIISHSGLHIHTHLLDDV